VVIAEVKAIACELPALRAVPLSRCSIADVREEAIACGLVEQVSVSTVWRWLDEDALKPWRHRSWIFPVPRTSPPRQGSCSTCASAGLWASGWGQTSSSSRPTKTSIQARCEATTGIAPFGRLVEQVMASEPYASAARVFWVVDNGSSHRGQASIDRLEGTGARS
jgi:hypothetical protein